MRCLRQTAFPAAKHAVAHSFPAQHHLVVAMHGHRVLVYSGEGAGSRSVLSAAETLRNTIRSTVQVAHMGPEELLAGEWTTSCLMLVMPGGADLPYCRQLNGLGNKIIRAYVEDGGAYLGLCAGAYFACSYVEFDLGTRLEVKGPRELAFFPGIACGPVYEGFRYESEAGAHAALVAFRLPQGSAMHAAHTDSGAGAADSGQRQEWVTCRDYTNGGPAFWPSEERGEKAFDVLAVYAEKDDALAAVRCPVGRGAAVLVGTHPELDPKWLQQESDKVPALEERLKRTSMGTAAIGVDSVMAVKQSVREQLERSAKKRHLLWTSLLEAAGLAEYLMTSHPNVL